MPQIVFVVIFSDKVPLMCQRYTEAIAIVQSVKRHMYIVTLTKADRMNVDSDK